MVWQKAHRFAVEVRAAFARCPAPDIATQIRRSSASVPANIVEGAGSQTNGLFIRFLGIALASAQESEYLLLLARDTGVLPPAEHDRLGASCTEIQKMLTGLLAAVRRGTAAAAAAKPARPEAGRRPTPAQPPHPIDSPLPTLD